jgi:hypothetical protein
MCYCGPFYMNSPSAFLVSPRKGHQLCGTHLFKLLYGLFDECVYICYLTAFWFQYSQIKPRSHLLLIQCDSEIH